VLPAYPVSRHLSAKLRVVTLLAVIAVVGVHAYNMSSRFISAENAAGMTSAPGVVGFIEYLIAQTLCRWPAATLFAISGFLFFRNLAPHWPDYARKFRRRLRTIVVPFLLWSALGLALYMLLQALPGSELYFSKDFLGQLSVGRLLEKLLWTPVPYPLWFLQTLILCIAVSPLLYWPVRWLRWLAVAPFAALWLLGAPTTNWSDWKGLAFFTLGAVLALELRRGSRVAPPAWVGRLLLPLWLACCVLFTALLRDEGASWAHTLHKALMCLAVAAMWLGYETYLEPFKDRRVVVALIPFSFVIFVAQEPLLTILKRVGLHALGLSGAVMLAVFFIAPLITLVIVVGAAALARRFVPRPYGWLTGSR
jgi:surface polysaccharide O-acyltransferase-like enzyme